jgi:hypothetical protein
MGQFGSRVPKNVVRFDLVIGISAPVTVATAVYPPTTNLGDGKWQAYLHRRCGPSWAAAKPDAPGWADDLTAGSSDELRAQRWRQ